MAELKDIDKGLKRFENLAYDRLAQAQVKVAVKMLEAVAVIRLLIHHAAKVIGH